MCRLFIRSKEKTKKEKMTMIRTCNTLQGQISVNRKLITLLALLILIPETVFAHGPSRQKVKVERDINASATDVWEIVGDFSALDKWLPPVEKCEIVMGENNKPDAIRMLTVGNSSIQEKLKSLNEKKRVLKYKIVKGDLSILPVSNYSATIAVKDNGNGGTIVIWKGAFYRGYQNNDPPPELDDKTAIAAVNALYNLGLDNLKNLMENP